MHLEYADNMNRTSSKYLKHHLSLNVEIILIYIFYIFNMLQGTTDSQEIYVCISCNCLGSVLPIALRGMYLNTVFGASSPVTIQHFLFY